MANLEHFGLDVYSQETLLNTLKDIDKNIVKIIWYQSMHFVKYSNGNMYHINDNVNTNIKKAIIALLEIQKNTGTNNKLIDELIINNKSFDSFFNLYMMLTVRYLITKTLKLEKYIKERDIYGLRPKELNF